MSNYSTETLTVLLQDLKEDLNKGFAGIHERQDKTNGRIKKLEIWRGYITGGLAILSIVLGIVIKIIK